MNRREAISTAFAAPLPAGGSIRITPDRRFLWFTGETAQPTFEQDNPWKRQGDITLRVDEVRVFETSDVTRSTGILVGSTYIDLMPDSYERLRKQWAAYWGIEE